MSSVPPDYVMPDYRMTDRLPWRGKSHGCGGAKAIQVCFVFAMREHGENRTDAFAAINVLAKPFVSLLVEGSDWFPEILLVFDPFPKQDHRVVVLVPLIIPFLIKHRHNLAVMNH